MTNALPTCLREPPAPTSDQLTEIAKLEAEARKCHQDAEDSFQRCDTDGFLSQWAAGISARLYETKAQILRTGGYSQFRVLCNADGEVIADRIYIFINQFAGYGTVTRWRLPDDLAAKYGRRWVPTAGYSGKSRVQKQLGLHEEQRWFPAYAKITTPPGAASTGLAGCANAYVGIFRADTDQE